MSELKAADKESTIEQRKHVHTILSKMSDLMFVSYVKSDPPELGVRPLHVTQLDDDDTIWFMTALDSSIVAEVKREAQVMLTGQDSAHWLRVDGRAEVVNDRAKIRALFNKMHAVWFPDGPDDPNICLVKLVPARAEYWDTSGVRGVKYLFEAARALLTGTEAKPVKGLHGDVRT